MLTEVLCISCIHQTRVIQECFALFSPLQRWKPENFIQVRDDADRPQTVFYWKDLFKKVTVQKIEDFPPTAVTSMYRFANKGPQKNPNNEQQAYSYNIHPPREKGWPIEE